MIEIVPVICDVRSLQNVGAIMRSAAAFGCKTFATVGITPHILIEEDTRLPHIAEKADKHIRKTALGAESMMHHIHFESIEEATKYFQQCSFVLAMLEQDERAVPLATYKATTNVALFVGPERYGFSEIEREMFDLILEIELPGQKQSLNVASACSIALFHLQKT